MCFSATASFTAGALPLGIGTLTLMSAKRVRQWPIASVPLLLVIQRTVGRWCALTALVEVSSI